jgi:hypothetical protein
MLSRILFALLLLATTLPAFAKERPVYQDGILQTVSTQLHGRSCRTYGDTSGDITARTDSEGQTTGKIDATTTSITNCRPSEVAYYTVTVGQQRFVVAAASNPMKAESAALTMGISSMFYKNCVLYGQLPGTAIKIRSDGNGNLHIKVGKRESNFKLISAQ